MAYSAAEFRAARTRKRMKQREVAQLLGVSERAVSRWEADGVPDGAHKLAEIERALGLGSPPPTPPTSDQHQKLTALIRSAERSHLVPALIDWALDHADDLAILAVVARRMATAANTRSDDLIANTPDQAHWPISELPSSRRAAANRGETPSQTVQGQNHQV